MSWLYSIIISGILISTGNESIAPIYVNEVGGDTHSTITASQDDVTDRFEANYPLAANGRISVSNVNGSISVEGWDRNEVKLEVIKKADSAETLSEVEVKITDRPDFLKIETDYKNLRYSGQNRRRKLEVNYKLTVPKNAILNSIETVNGTVAIKGVHGEAKASAVNGNVDVANIRSDADLSTVNGEVIADFDNVETGGRISLNTVNGSVKVTFPSDLNATLKAESLNGNISNDFGLPVKRGEYVGRNMHGRIGNGATQIKLNSVNGALTILRKKDGKSAAPAVDLLGDDVGQESGKIREQRRALADARRQTSNEIRKAEREFAIALKTAQAELRTAKPGIEKAQAEMNKLQANNDRLMNEQLRALASLNNIAWRNPAPMVQRKSSSFDVKGTPKIIVEAVDCDVIFRGTDASTVRYVLSEFGAAKGDESAGLTEDRNGNEIKLKVDGAGTPIIAGFRSGGSHTRLEIFVPRRSDIVVRADGAVRVSNISGSIDIKGEDHSIDVRDSKGKLKIAASDGQVRVIGFNGELESNVTDGDVFLEGTFDAITSKAIDGTVTITVPEGLSAMVTSSGDIEAVNTSGKQETSRKLVFGEGLSKYNFDFSDGRLIVRSARSINVE